MLFLKGENNTIEKEEYKALADKIMHIPAFNHSDFKMLKFKVQKPSCIESRSEHC